MSPDHPSYLDLRGSTLLAIPQIYLNPQELSGDDSHHHHSPWNFAKDAYLYHCQVYQEENGKVTGRKCGLIIPTPYLLMTMFLT